MFKNSLMTERTQIWHGGSTCLSLCIKECLRNFLQIKISIVFKISTYIRRNWKILLKKIWKSKLLSLRHEFFIFMMDKLNIICVYFILFADVDRIVYYIILKIGGDFCFLLHKPFALRLFFFLNNLIEKYMMMNYNSIENEFRKNA